MSIKVYLAGSCSQEKRTMMHNIAAELREYGYEVYCPFELKIENAWDMSQEEWAKKVFEADIAAIDACNIFLMITPGRNSTAGTNWEQGYAYAKGKYIAVVQYTEDDTSLMTYSSANCFLNAEVNDIAKIAVWAANPSNGGNYSCTTILT